MTVPANTSADLYLPVSEEQAQGLELPEGVAYVGTEARNSTDCAKFSVESGSYTLTVQP